MPSLPSNTKKMVAAVDAGELLFAALDAGELGDANDILDRNPESVDARDAELRASDLAEGIR